MCTITKSVQFHRWRKKKKATHRWHYWWASCILVLCPSGTNTLETIRNRRLICSEETPASLREVNGSFGDKTMILNSLVFWASFNCDWQSHKSIQEHFGRAKLEIFFFFLQISASILTELISKTNQSTFDSTNEWNEAVFLRKLHSWTRREIKV